MKLQSKRPPSNTKARQLFVVGVRPRRTLGLVTGGERASQRSRSPGHPVHPRPHLPRGLENSAVMPP